VWCVLLVASWSWRTARPPEVIPAGAQRFELAALDADSSNPATVALDVWEHGPATAPTVLLLHGSPGHHGNFDSMLPFLDSDHRLLVPDLPGFGVSSKRLSDYSPEAHAHYLAEWLQDIDARKVHVVGHSMGGAVALRLQAIAPERIASITLMASLGVEELELLGDATLNKALHAVLLGLVKVLDYGLPHFGALHSFPVNHAHARNFFDDDQSELRGLMEQVNVPFFILHGAHDLQVPVAAAKEHWRIIPQAKIHVFEHRGHFLPWQEPGPISDLVREFVGSVQAGTAMRREQSDPDRLAKSLIPFDPASIPPVEGGSLVLLMVLLAFATLISEDLTCLLAGWLVSLGRLSFPSATLACFTGILVGDLMLYLVGRVAGRPALRRRPLAWFVKPESLDKASHWMQTRGASVIFLSRFTPGLRLPTYLLAGALHTRFLAFAGYFALACALWTPVLVGLSAFFGERFSPENGTIGDSLWKVIPALILLWLLVRKVLLPACTWTGRRRLVGSYRRLTQFEFWHPVAIYAPLIPYLLWQSLRHRSLAPFSATNPGMLGSGFAGESKGDILDGFAGDARIPAYLRLPATGTAVETFDQILAWQATLSNAWPLVIKPDVGERGKSVHIVRSEDRLRAALAGPGAPWIVQEFVHGEEFGIFFKRDPRSGETSLISITRKVLPMVIGDGTSTIGHLVYRDARAVAIADAYEKDLGERWHQVPAANEKVCLVEVGTHSRGAIFLDGAELSTPALLKAVDELSQGFQPLAAAPDDLFGLYLGRYDLMVPDAQALIEGRDLSVIELNGITSEPTHIYDPRHGPLYGWRTLARQWRDAYSIGAYNARAGAPSMGLGKLLRLWRRNN
jgi:pimeloyl-ACP methyl ester carboxylesterase/membrane protein DedA with SNARE-associated domain